MKHLQVFVAVTTRFCVTAAILTAITPWGSAEAQVYQWRDPQTGKAVISNIPPAPGTNTKIIRNIPDETAAPSNEMSEAASAEGKTENQEKKADKKTEKNQNAALCTSTLENISHLESTRPVAGPDGKVFDEKERAAELKRSQDILRLFCNNS